MTVESNHAIALVWSRLKGMPQKDLIKVIPQYCTAHPVLRIITHNKIQVIW